MAAALWRNGGGCKRHHSPRACSRFVSRLQRSSSSFVAPRAGERCRKKNRIRLIRSRCRIALARFSPNRAHMAYDHGGRKALKTKPSGGRKRENMTLAEEKALLDRFAKAAGAGEMLNIHDIKAAYEKAIGHETSNSTIYNLLARHGWRKLMPRPFHPKRNIAAQNAFKKTAFQML